MNRRKVANLVMAIVMLAIFASGIYYVLNLKSGNTQDSLASIKMVKGNVDIERKGVSYSLSNGTNLISGDTIQTRDGSNVTISLAKKNQIVLNEQTKVTINKEGQIQLEQGDVYITVKQKGLAGNFVIGQSKVNAIDAVFGLSAYPGSQSIYCLSGNVTYVNKKAKKTLKSGHLVTIDGNEKSVVEELKSDQLNAFYLTKIGEEKNDTKLAVLKTDVKKTQESRKKQVTQVKEPKKTDKPEQSSRPTASPVVTKSPETTTKPTVTPATTTKPTPAKQTAKPAQEKKTKYAKIAIVCDTILNHQNDLKKEKSKYVPSNGVILRAVQVEIKDGDSVYDVLKRTCKQHGIQLEASYTPGYGSYYVEGIHQLYEFDCGSGSGWTYKVNGYKPNYGASGYKVKDGDVILWSYTCDYGNDI